MGLIGLSSWLWVTRWTMQKLLLGYRRLELLLHAALPDGWLLVDFLLLTAQGNQYLQIRVYFYEFSDSFTDATWTIFKTCTINTSQTL